ncbi:MAG: hypothetical protein JWP34_5419 [Massilia sp.]|nr:hypothetical protein [Massilia sp.]
MFQEQKPRTAQKWPEIAHISVVPLASLTGSIVMENTLSPLRVVLGEAMTIPFLMFPALHRSASIDTTTTSTLSAKISG